MPSPSTLFPAIIFDLGGVLIDWNPRYLYRKLFPDDAAIERFLNQVGFSEWNLEQDRGRTFAEAVPLLAARYPRYADAIRAYDERYPESLGGPIQGTVAILAALKQAGYPLYALSNWSAEKFQVALALYPFLAWFDDLVISAHVKLVKPDPRIFALALERIGRPASECLFIDDSETNVETARQIGLPAIQYRSPQQLAYALQQFGIQVTHDGNP